MHNGSIEKSSFPLKNKARIIAKYIDSDEFCYNDNRKLSEKAKQQSNKILITELNNYCKIGLFLIKYYYTHLMVLRPVPSG